MILKSCIFLKRYFLKVLYKYSNMNLQISDQRKKLMRIFIFIIFCGTWKRF